MKNLIRIFLILTIIGGAVSLHSACSDENDCSLAGRPMMYCTIYTINPDNPTIALKDTLDSLTITALGTDSIILNNERMCIPDVATYDTQVTLLCSYSDTIPNVEKKILTHYTLYNKILLISSPWNVVI